MTRPAWRNVALAVVFALVLGLNLLLTPDPTERNFELLPDMVESVAYDSFAPNPVFADGKTLQRPPAGTIPVGAMPLHYGATPAEADRAGRELANPFAPPDPAPSAAPAAAGASPEAKLRVEAARAAETAYRQDLTRGEAVFATFCQVCHGDSGLGDGPVAKRGFPAPPSLVAQHALDMPDGKIFHLVTYGGTNMPSYAAQVPRADRWKAILYVRELQRRGLAAARQAAAAAAAAAPLPAAPGTAAASPAAGATVQGSPEASP